MKRGAIFLVSSLFVIGVFGVGFLGTTAIASAPDSAHHEFSWTQRDWSGGATINTTDSDSINWDEYESTTSANVIAAEQLELSGLLPVADCSASISPPSGQLDGSGNWVLNNGDSITGGTYCLGDKNFTLNGTVTVSGDKPFIIQANTIQINGTLDGKGRATPGGGVSGDTLDNEDPATAIYNGSQGGTGQNSSTASGGSGGSGGIGIGVFANTLELSAGARIDVRGTQGSTGASDQSGCPGCGGGGGGGNGGSGGVLFMSAETITFSQPQQFQTTGGAGGSGGSGGTYTQTVYECCSGPPWHFCWEEPHPLFCKWPDELGSSSTYTYNTGTGGTGSTGANGYVKIYYVVDVSNFNRSDFDVSNSQITDPPRQRLGSLEESLISSQLRSNSEAAQWTSISWREELGATGSTQIQLRTAPDDSSSPGTWSGWTGASGVGSSFSSDEVGCSKDSVTGMVTCPISPSSPLSNGLNDQWIQYQVTLDADAGNFPIADDITIDFYKNEAPTPPTIIQNDTVIAGSSVVIPYTITDPEFDLLDIDQINPPTNGSIDFSTPGQVTYTHTASNTDPDTFTLRIFDLNPEPPNDRFGTSATAVFNISIASNDPVVSVDSAQKGTHPPAPIDFVITAEDAVDGHAIDLYFVDMDVDGRIDGNLRFDLGNTGSWDDSCYNDSACSIPAGGEENLTVRYVPIHDTDPATFDEWGFFGMDVADPPSNFFWDMFSVTATDEYGSSGSINLEVGLHNNPPTNPSSTPLTPIEVKVVPGGTATFKTDVIPWPDLDIPGSALAPWSGQEPVFWEIDPAGTAGLLPTDGAFQNTRGYLGEDIIFNVSPANPASVTYNLNYRFVDPWAGSPYTGIITFTVEPGAPDITGTTNIALNTGPGGDFCLASRGEGHVVQYKFEVEFNDTDGDATQAMFQATPISDTSWLSPHFEFVQTPPGNIYLLSASDKSTGSFELTATLRQPGVIWNPGLEQLDYDVDYKWRVRMLDSGGNMSDWVEGDPFSTPDHPYPKVSFDWSPNPVFLESNTDVTVRVETGEELLKSFYNPDPAVFFAWTPPATPAPKSVTLPDPPCNIHYIPAGAAPYPDSCSLDDAALTLVFNVRDLYPVELEGTDASPQAFTCSRTRDIQVKPALPTFDESGSR